MRKFILVFGTALTLMASTPQERAIRRLEKQQHRVLVDNARSDKLGTEARSSCEAIGKTLQLSNLAVLYCGPAPTPAPAPMPAKVDPPAPAKTETPAPSVPAPDKK